MERWPSPLLSVAAAVVAVAAAADDEEQESPPPQKQRRATAAEGPCLNCKSTYKINAHPKRAITRREEEYQFIMSLNDTLTLVLTTAGPLSESLMSRRKTDKFCVNLWEDGSQGGLISCLVTCLVTRFALTCHDFSSGDFSRCRP